MKNFFSCCIGPAGIPGIQGPCDLAGQSGKSRNYKEGNVYLTTHSTHFIYGYMASDIW